MKAAPHVAVHTPSEHTWPAAHARPHAPQFARSVPVFVSHPSTDVALQSAWPSWHRATSQLPATHVAVAFATAQLRPHAPQFASALVVSVSHPLSARPSQSPRPASQRSTAHAPAEQPLVACDSAHTVPQPPQLSGSVAVLAQ